MTLYIIGTVKKEQVMQGFIIMDIDAIRKSVQDSTNNQVIQSNQVRVVTKDKLIAVMRSNKGIIKNAKMQGDKIVGSHYPLSDLSSIVYNQRGVSKLEDRGVLAVAPINSNQAFICTRIQKDISKTIVVILDTKKIAPASIKLINKDNNNRIITCESGQSLHSGQSLQSISKQSMPRQNIAGTQKQQSLQNGQSIQSKQVTSTPIQQSNQVQQSQSIQQSQPTPQSIKSNNSMSDEEVIRRVMNPNEIIDFDTFDRFMKLKDWKYNVDKAIADIDILENGKYKSITVHGYKITYIDDKCDILHLPEEVIRVDIQNDKRIKLFVVEKNAVSISGRRLEIDSFVARGVYKADYHFDDSTIGEICLSNIHMLTYSFCHCTINGNIIFNNIDTVINSFNDTAFTASEVRISGKADEIDSSFKNTKFIGHSKVYLGIELKNLQDAFKESNIIELTISSHNLELITSAFLKCNDLISVDLSECDNMRYIHMSFDNCPNLSTFILPPVISNRNKLTIAHVLDHSDIRQLSLPENTYGILDVANNNNHNAVIKLPRTLKKLLIFESWDGTTTFDYSALESANVTPELPYHVGGYHTSKPMSYGYRTLENCSKLSAIDVLPSTVKFLPSALSRIPVGLFDTKDFVNLDTICSEFFGTSDRGSGTGCAIKTIIIDDNIKSIEASGFINCRGALQILIHPSVKIDEKAFSYILSANVVTVYMSSKVPVYKALKNKKSLKLVPIDTEEEFRALRNETVAKFRGEISADGRYKMLIDSSDEIYVQLFNSRYSGNIDWLYKYFYSIRNANLTYFKYKFDDLDRSHYIADGIPIESSKKLTLMIDEQLPYMNDPKLVNKTLSGEKVFIGLSNLFTRLLERDDILLTHEFLNIADRWLAYDIISSCTRRDTKSEAVTNFLKDMNKSINADIEPITKINTDISSVKAEILGEEESSGEQSPESVAKIKRLKTELERLRAELKKALEVNIHKWEYYDLPTSKLMQLMKDGVITQSRYELLSDKFDQLRMHRSKVLYIDENRNAIVLIKTTDEQLDENQVYNNISNRGLYIVFIIESGKIVWASTLNYKNGFQERFLTNFNRLTSDMIDPLIVLKEGDIISRGEEVVVNGISIESTLMTQLMRNPELKEHALNENKGLANSEFTGYIGTSVSGNSFMQKFHDFTIVIGANGKSSKGINLLAYDYVAQRFFEITASIKFERGDSIEISELKEYQTLRRATNIFINKVYTWEQIDEIPAKYLEYFRTKGKHNYKIIESMKYRDVHKIEETLSDISNYDINVGKDLANLAKMAYESGKCNIKNITQNFLKALELLGLMDTKKVNIDNIIYGRKYARITSEKLPKGMELREYEIDTGMRELETDITHSYMTKYVILINKEDKIMQKMQKVYTSLISLEDIIKLLNKLGEIQSNSSAYNLVPIGGIKSLVNSEVYSSDRLEVIYTNEAFRLRYNQDTDKFTSYELGMSYTQREYPEEFMFGIAVDLASCEIYLVQIVENGTIPIFRYRTFKEAINDIHLRFCWQLDSASIQLARLVVDERNNILARGDRVHSISKYDLISRHLIVKGINNVLWVNRHVLKYYGLEDEEVDYGKLAEILERLPKQPEK